MLTVSLTSTTLNHAEASGITSGALGMIPVRRARLPADWPSPVLRFLAPSSSPSRPRPQPSARRPAPPRRVPPLSAA